jgi:hypothetical protein
MPALPVLLVRLSMARKKSYPDTFEVKDNIWNVSNTRNVEAVLR